MQPFERANSVTVSVKGVSILMQALNMSIETEVVDDQTELLADLGGAARELFDLNVT